LTTSDSFQRTVPNVKIECIFTAAPERKSSLLTNSTITIYRSSTRNKGVWYIADDCYFLFQHSLYKFGLDRVMTTTKPQQGCCFHTK